MRYLIATILLGVVMFLSLLVLYCLYMAFSDTWQWSLVGLGILMPDIVAFLAFSSAVSAIKDY